MFLIRERFLVEKLLTSIKIKKNYLLTYLHIIIMMLIINYNNKLKFTTTTTIINTDVCDNVSMCVT